MPVLDGIFEPRAPLTAAEQHVDFPGHDTHIVRRRQATERHATPTVNRAAYLLAHDYSHPVAVETELSDRLAASLNVTAEFGYRAVRREILAQRGTQARAAYQIPDAGHHAAAAEGGLPAVHGLVARRAQTVAQLVLRAAAAEAVKQRGTDPVLAAAAVAKAGLRTLHNSVLELVGETLNLGRTAGALSLPAPPEFALRSEQLDKATCDPCTRLHGTVAQVGSDDYYRLLPPADCLGGGRCRGIMVFGDTQAGVGQQAA